MEKIKDFLRNSAKNGTLFSALVLMYPFVFFLSKNPDIFDLEQILAGFLFICALFCINLILDLPHKFLKLPKGLILVMVSALEGIWILNNVVFRFSKEDSIVISIFIVFVLICALLHLKNNTKILCVFLTIALCLTAWNYYGVLSFNIRQEKILDKIVEYSEKDEVFDGLKLKKKPNIYYFYMESYSGKDFLKNEIGYDNSEFYNFLNSKGFEVQDIYSNYNFTRASICSTLMMEYIPFLSTKNYKKIFSENNETVEVLKQNGYEINYYLRFANYYLTKNNSATRTNYKYNPYSFIIRLKTPQTSMQPLFADMETRINTVDYYGNLKTMVKNALESASPQFFIIKTIPVSHHPIEYRYLSLKEQKEISEKDFNLVSYKYFQKWYDDFPKNMDTENEHLKEVVNFILEKDPNALILMLGDHGVNKYRSFNYTEDLQTALKKANISEKQYIDGDFNVIYALKYPYNKKFTFETPSNVNVFRYIFAELSESSNLIKTLKPAYSFTMDAKGYKVVKNGKILANFEPAQQ